MRETAKSVQEYFPDLEIEFWDERFTTTIAQQALLEAATAEDRAGMLIALLQMGAHASPGGEEPPMGRKPS